MGLAFLVYVAILARFAPDTGATEAPFVESWTIGSFALLVILVGAAFSRGIELARPSSLAKPIIRSFGIEATESVREICAKNHAFIILSEGCDAASDGVGRKGSIRVGSFLPQGRPILASRSGLVSDLDLAFISKLGEMVKDADCEISVGLHQRASERTALVRVEGSPITDTLRSAVVRSFVVREPSRKTTESDVYAEAIAFARRTLETKQARDLALANELIVGSFLEMAKAWDAYGNPTRHAPPDGFFPVSPEEEMGDGLRDLCRRFLRSNEEAFIEGVGDLARELTVAGEGNDSDLLLDQGLGLFGFQARLLDQMPSGPAKDLVANNSINLIASLYRGLRYSLDDESSDKSARERAAQTLPKLTDRIVDVLKSLIDSRYRELVDDTLDSLVRVGARRSLADEIEDAKLIARTNDDPDAVSNLAELEAVAALSAEADRYLADRLFELGAWFFGEARDNTESQEPLSSLWWPLISATNLPSALRCLLKSSGHRELSLLNSWYIDSKTSAGQRSWAGDGQGRAWPWAALIVLLIQENDDELSDWARRASEVEVGSLIVNLDALLSEWEIWEGLLPKEQAEIRLEHVKEILTEGIVQGKLDEQERIASADLDQELVAIFVNDNVQEAKKSRRLFDLVQEAGTYAAEISADADGDYSAVEDRVPKRYFVADGIPLSSGPYGQVLGRKLDAKIWDRLSTFEHLGMVDLDKLASVVEEEKARGDSHLTLLVADRFQCRMILFDSEHFEAERTSGSQFGRFAGIDVHLLVSQELVGDFLLGDIADVSLNEVTDENGEPFFSTLEAFTQDSARAFLSKEGTTEVAEQEIQALIDSDVYFSIRAELEVSSRSDRWHSGTIEGSDIEPSELRRRQRLRGDSE